LKTIFVKIIHKILDVDTFRQEKIMISIK